MRAKVWKYAKTIGVAGTAALISVVYYQHQKQYTPVHASWTTNFEPSVKWDENWDRRNPESIVKPLKSSATEKDKKDYDNELQKQTSTASRHLLLIRHGQYVLDGATDQQRILTALGRKQAAYTGQRLKDMGYNYTDLISSTMARAVETSDIIHKFLPNLSIERDPLLCEGAPIPPEPPVGHWRPEKSQFYQDGSRIEAAFRKYFHRAEPSQTTDSYEIIVCHANVIRYFVCRALQFPPEAWLRLGLHHSSITWITIRPSGRVSLRQYGDSGFIPIEEVSSA
ncbi:hypothetical protein FSP39_006095 [Pinctada imbricata]|uniref:Serine/threonine-protein phosphatase PGAM5, mitochondrial n=1 Tax=Pinctada imbricata TaxID=66713 RepID=A0AA88XMP0_PINIB|nr:hypothetical protein FSP39_006095 [Pinctada imbricata]